MKNKKVIAFIVLLISMVWPFSVAFVNNDVVSNTVKIIMFVLFLVGAVFAFVYANSAETSEH